MVTHNRLPYHQAIPRTVVEMPSRLSTKSPTIDRFPIRKEKSSGAMSRTWRARCEDGATPHSDDRQLRSSCIANLLVNGERTWSFRGPSLGPTRRVTYAGGLIPLRVRIRAYTYTRNILLDSVVSFPLSLLSFPPFLFAPSLSHSFPNFYSTPSLLIYHTQYNVFPLRLLAAYAGSERASNPRQRTTERIPPRLYTVTRRPDAVCKQTVLFNLWADVCLNRFK